MGLIRHVSRSPITALALLLSAAAATPATTHAVQPVVQPRTDRSPAPSHVEAVAFDSARGRLILFGGARPSGNSGWVDSDETWEWDGTRWHSLDATTPKSEPRHGHALGYDARDRRMLLVGGVRTPPGAKNEEPLDDTWTYDGVRWSRGPNAPLMSVAYDGVGRRVVPIGGLGAQSREPLGDTWTRDGERWHALETEPIFTAARGAFIALSVADLDASVRWYTEKLGLQVVARPPKIQQSTAVILEGGNLIVELLHHDAAVPSRAAAPTVSANYLVHGIFKAGIIVEDFDKTIMMLRERGVPIAIGPFPATAEQRANAIIKDNAGNYIQFFGPR